ncbi:hypothetical protein VTJ04DRAFT_3888 [Mycothermus thermophilus]|uniref:uncharacterized protein n=1 Tax=Humicola insolens TaxID=85995 RepID=UPI003744ABBA
MSDIYGQAAVTFAAGDSGANAQGLLTRHNGPPADFEVPFSTGGTVLLYEARYSTYNRSWIDSVLNTRAWTIQEMLLSPRVLFYTAHDVYWLCKRVENRIMGFHFYPEDEDYKLEMNISGREICHSVYTYFMDHSIRAIWHDILSCVDEDDSRRYFTRGQYWAKLLQQYFKHDLTFQSDRLQALEGLAAAAGSITGDRYVFGHWERDLPWSLQWYSEQSGWSDIGAPSWSWASASGPVMLFREFPGPAAAELKNISQTGEVLELESLVVPIVELYAFIQEMKPPPEIETRKEASFNPKR